MWLNAHRLIAVTVGAVIALLGLSGAALVLKGSLIRHDFGAETFDLASVEQPWASIDSWIANAQRLHPQVQTVVSLSAPGETPLPTQAALLTAVLTDGGFGFVTIDPRTARPLGFFRYGEGSLFTLLDFHRHLLPEALEDVGESIALWSGLLLLVSIGSGLYLWWPRSGTWRQALQFRAGAQLWRSVHTTTALCALLPLTLLTITGLLLAKPDSLATISPAAAHLIDASRNTPCRAVKSYDDAVVTALAATSAKAFASVAATPNGGYAVTVREAGPSHDLRGVVVVDGRCAGVAEQPPTQSVWSEHVQRLHANLRLGRPGQAIVLLTGLALPMLYLSGLSMWWRRRERRGQ